MVAAKLQTFGGMIPAVDDFLLPDNSASFAENVWLYSGRLQGIWVPKLVYTTLSADTRKVFRIPKVSYDRLHIEDSWWLEFTDPNTDVLHSPVSEDTFDRYYWTSVVLGPHYNTLARIANGDPAYVLGVPNPTVAPTITVGPSGEPFVLGASHYEWIGYPATLIYGATAGARVDNTGFATAQAISFVSSGTENITETRSYVYTWVTTYGEEGPPSPATVVTGVGNGTWHVAMTAPGILDTTDRTLAFTRIYRTVTATDGTVNYFFVAEVPIATLTYDDTILSADITGGQTLQSSGWTAPPDDLEGWVSLANGMIAGWRRNEIWFCEPYRPHAWPVAYTISIEFNIVGLGVSGQTLIVLTNGFPYGVTGINPASMSAVKVQSLEPCLSRASIVSTPDGVYYASPTGLALANPSYGTVIIATKQLITKDKWGELIHLEKLKAGRLGTAYFAFGSVEDGVFEPTAFEPTAFEQQDFTSSLDGILIEPTDQRVALSRLTADVPNLNVIQDVWTSELFVIRGQSVLWFSMSTGEQKAPYKWRSKRMQTPNSKNFGAMKVYFEVVNDITLNPVRNTSQVQTLAADQYALVRMYADGVLVMTREIRESGELIRPPSGFTADWFQVEVESNVEIKNIQLAGTVKELASV